MSRSRSKRSKGSQLPLFIQKLIQMLEDQSIDQIISWTSTNDSFNIKMISPFTQQILPKFFKHNNFSSFIRQLNMYGFRKIRHEDGQNVYQNQNFKRGNRALLKNIKRKINQQKDDKLALFSYQGANQTINLTRQLQQMKNKQKDLQQICRHLFMQNKKLIQDNNTLMKKMKTDERRKERKMEELILNFITPNNSIKALENGQSTLSNCNNEKQMLSIIAKNNEGSRFMDQNNEESPLDMMTKLFAKNKNIKQFKHMLENYFSDKHDMPNNRVLTRKASQKLSSEMESQNFDSVDHINHEDQRHFDMHNDDSSFHFGSSQYSHPLPLEVKDDKQDDGFLSINEFVNLDDDHMLGIMDDNINLQESR